MYSISKNIQIVIASLKAHNINQLVLSPGGTNAPFIKSVQDDVFFTCYSVVDERSALYFAIGIYLATGKPVAVCCTSAQATRNYIPGLTEAFYKHVPILAITFSKHYRFIGQDYMQAPNQTSLPVDAVRKSFALPYVSNNHDYMHCVRLANEAILELMHKTPGPIQLNVPMLDSELGKYEAIELPNIRIINRYSKEDVKGISLKSKKILIVVGENRGFDDKELIAFANKCNAAIYVNHLSNMRNDFTIEGNLLLTCIPQDFFDKNLCPDVLITIGGQTGDYPLFYKLTQGNNDYEHWRVADIGDIVDTYDHLTRVYECSADDFFCNVSAQTKDHSYLNQWKEAVNKCTTEVDLPLSNAYVAQCLHTLIPEGSYVNFAILNSLRIWNLFHIKNRVRCFSNVGAFGIDGGLSTFIGQSVAVKELCFMIIGDLAFFYDMNALGIRHIKNNVRIVLINNNGGIEFKYGGDYETRRNIDRYIAAAGHFKNSEGWALTNGFEYYAIHSKEELSRIAEKITKNSPRPIVVEVFTTDSDEAEAMSIIRKINDSRSITTRISNKIKSKISIWK